MTKEALTYKEFYNQNVKYPTVRDSVDHQTRKRYKKLAGMICSVSKSIADAGCRDHSFFQFLLSKRKFRKRFSQLVGFDIIEESIKHANAQNLPNCTFVVQDITTLIGKNQFDTVICQEVLEHLSDDDFEKTIKRLYDLANYQLILTVPFDESRPAPMKCMRFGVDCTNSPSGHLQFGLREDSFLKIIPKNNTLHKISFRKIRYRKLKRKTNKISWLRWFLANILLLFIPRRKLLVIEFFKGVNWREFVKEHSNQKLSDFQEDQDK